VAWAEAAAADGKAWPMMGGCWEVTCLSGRKGIECDGRESTTFDGYLFELVIGYKRTMNKLMAYSLNRTSCWTDDTVVTIESEDRRRCRRRDEILRIRLRGRFPLWSREDAALK